MYSFFVYFFIIFFSTLFIWVGENLKTPLVKRFFYLLSFMIVFYPSAIRYGVGTDFWSYLDIYNYLNVATKGEYGFFWVNELLRYFELSASWAIAIYAFIFTLFAYLAYPSKHKWLFHFLFMAGVLFFSFNVIRQAISLAIVTLAIKSETNEKSLRPFVLVVLAALFHQSAIFMIFIMLSSRFPLKDSIKTRMFPAVVIGLSLFVWFGPSFVKIVEMLAVKLNLPYLHYFEGSYFQKIRISSGFLTMVKVMVLLIMIGNAKEVLKKSNRNWLIVLCAGLYAVTYSLASESAAFGRLAYTFLPGAIFFIYLYVIYTFKRSSFHYLLAVLVIILYTLPYFVSALSSNDYNSDNHYRTIFNKDL